MKFIVTIVVFCAVLALYHIWVTIPVKEQYDQRYARWAELNRAYVIGHETFLNNYRQHIGACNSNLFTLLEYHGIKYSVDNNGHNVWANEPIERQLVISLCRCDKASFMNQAVFKDD